MNPKLLLAYLFLFLFVAGCAAKDDKRFDLSVDDTVLDKETGLMWAKTDNRANIDWNDAVNYCENYRGGGYTDWRLPNKDELEALYQLGIRAPEKKKPSLFGPKKKTAIQISDRSLWASSTRGSEATYCNFSNGMCSFFEKVMSITLRALPVRQNTATTVRKTSPNEASPSPTESREDKDELIVQKMRLLKKMYEDELLTEEEYQQKKKALLENF